MHLIDLITCFLEESLHGTDAQAQQCEYEMNLERSVVFQAVGEYIYTSKLSYHCQTT
jgi:hypothetical protein